MKNKIVTCLQLGFLRWVARPMADRLVIKGSDTLGAKLVPQLAEQFKAQHPGTTFDIAAEGSTTGIAAIIDGTAQIGMSSRRAKPAEVSAASGKGINMKPTIVAYDGIAVIVNSANPLKGLTKKQVEQIFTGDVTDWSAVGGSAGKISIYTRNTSSGTYSDFKELAMKKRDYAGSSQKMAGNEQIAAEVGKNRERGWLCRPGLYKCRPESKRCRSMALCRPCKLCMPRLIPMRGRPSTTRTANRTAWRKSFSISPSAKRDKRSLRRSDSFQFLSPGTG